MTKPLKSLTSQKTIFKPGDLVKLKEHFAIFGYVWGFGIIIRGNNKQNQVFAYWSALKCCAGCHMNSLETIQKAPKN